MALYKTITVDLHTKVLIWKIEEPEEALRAEAILTPRCHGRLDHMRSELHRRGFLSVRLLLQQAGYTAENLYYDDWGKPHLEDGTYISITHSFIFSGIVLSTHPVGIDIELQRPKISSIADKFIAYEYAFLDRDDVRRLTAVWCFKESLYKVVAKSGLSFKDHCRIIPFELTESLATAWVCYRETMAKYRLGYLEFEGFTCAWALKEGNRYKP